MSNIDKSNKSADLEGTPSSGIPRLHKGDDENALDYRKNLQRWDEEDKKKIQEGTYQGDASTWKPRVASKYRLPLTPQEDSTSHHTPLSPPPRKIPKEDSSRYTPQYPPPGKNNSEGIKIAIIIPFRDNTKDKTRMKQLNQLSTYFDSYLKAYNFEIFVVEQSDDGRKFNRGQLLNIGFEYAVMYGCTNFIFHDVDLLPSEELKEYYINTPKKEPVHIAAVWDRYNSNPKYFGGIVAFDKEMFEKINGYPNNFWGWGGEDDALYKRTKKFYNILKVKKGSIKDLEDLNLQEKLDYLKENDLKFMLKDEALDKHESTWEKNGLNSLNYKQGVISNCGKHCMFINVTLSDTENVENINASIDKEIMKEVPQEIFSQDGDEVVVVDKKIPPQQRLDNLIKTYYSTNPYAYNPNINHELEVKFGTKGIKQLTRNDYDNVVKKLKSSGFRIPSGDTGEYYLRIQCEFLDSVTGRFKMSDVRTEITSLQGVQYYCNNNDLKQVNSSLIDFIHKRPGFINKEKIFPVDVDDFNFRVSYQTEEKVKQGVKNFILENWKKSKKEFRLLNRVTFEHNDYPFKVDVSISKFANRGPDKFGRENRGPMIRTYTVQESNVFNNQENYEIEIEIDNTKIGPSALFNTPDKIATALRKVIKIILSGLQGTNYPISYPEQKQVIDSYMRMIWKDSYDPSKFIQSKNFIGPNSITLQLKNIVPIDENSNEPNIRKDFVVTDKADGERHLMYISNEGKIYLINTSMDVIFTGAKTNEKDCFNSLLDGELISHDKNGKFINLYAAFDLYYFNNKDIRDYSFMLADFVDDINKTRYRLLKTLTYILKPVSILDTAKPEENKKQSMKDLLSRFSKSNDFISPIKVSTKEFFPSGKKESIFEGCNNILQKENEGRFEYITDGLIFTHAHYGVGSNEIGKAGPKTRVTWEYSFKWKPPQYNTIDFLVTTLKSANGDDVIKSYYEDGLNTSAAIQYDEYKTLELRCGFKESKDGFINPCQDVIDDKLPDYGPRFDDKQENDYIPMRFYPTEPYDPNAGICNIPLVMDGNGGKNMFSEEGEVFGDNTIVEFRYDLDKKSGWNWVPLRVRHDKTGKLRRGEKEYGNAYKVCNENWKSIHPSGRITKDMLCTGLDIPSLSVSEDVYYNTPSGKYYTEAMKDFHNLYVKRRLIVGASKQGDTLIDFACGKAGDLPKWISSKLSFVFGIDISKDNLENRLDGACARFLKMKKSNKNIPYALFVNGNSSYNIKDGSAMLSDKAKQITSAVFGRGPKEAEKIGKGVARQYGRGDEGFNVSSCQFAIHYFFETPDTLKGFMKNIAECTKHNGYFIGTCYDGKMIFKELKKTKTGDSVKIIEDGKKIWEITKGYGSDSFDDNSSSIGYRIDVFQESINQTISEYLVNFEYLDRVMSAYGFEVISREEAQDLGLPDGSGLFSELFSNMLDEISKNKFKAKDYGKSQDMTTYEKKISFLNRYFVYKKIRTVNTENVELELGEYEESSANRNKETKHAQEVAEEYVKKIKPKVRKLTKKLFLIPATEAIDEPKVIIPSEKQVKKTKKVKEENKPKTSKKMLIIESDEDED